MLVGLAGMFVFYGLITLGFALKVRDERRSGTGICSTLQMKLHYLSILLPSSYKTIWFHSYCIVCIYYILLQKLYGLACRIHPIWSYIGSYRESYRNAYRFLKTACISFQDEDDNLKYLSLVCTFLLLAFFQIGPGKFITRTDKSECVFDPLVPEYEAGY